MIVGIFLRYIKTYRGYNYIPLAKDDKFCGLVGNNGVGKSSILEALDALFNEKSLNLNFATKKSGLIETNPHVLPIFLVKKTDLKENVTDLANVLSKLAIEITEDDVNASIKPHIKNFIAHRSDYLSAFDMNEHYLLPVGIDQARQITLSIFNCRKLVEFRYGANADTEQTALTTDQVKEFTPLLTAIKASIEFIYIPKEIDSEAFTKLETAEIQALMGESLNEILEKRVPKTQIHDINQGLNDFLNQLSSELADYSYRTPTDRQHQLKKNDLYNLIIQAFFNIRKLHKKQGDNWLEINSLSSGEKQKAIINVAQSLIKKHRTSGENLILAVDEPESSLHMSACFDQFDSLYEISRSCRQLLFATHWYGFFPTIESGSASVITKSGNQHVVDLINLSNHREQVKQIRTSSKGNFPYDIRLKSINDLVQSIITSTISDTPYNWIVCEGSSEKIYFSAYFKDLIEKKRVRIIPVGGANEIKKLYQHLAISYEELKKEVRGKIILISDTDPQLVNYEVTSYPSLYCKRIVNSEDTRETLLVDINSNPVSPKTEIEDVLNGKCFFETLKTFIQEYPDLVFLNELTVQTEEASYFALDLKSTQRKSVERFFDSGNNKFEFAKRYISILKEGMSAPDWIKEIRGWIGNH